MRTLTCILLTVWGISHAAPPPATCPTPMAPENGQIEWLVPQTMVRFFCDEGYALNGPDHVNCFDGIWIPDSPTCEQITGLEASEDPEFDGDVAEKNDSADGMMQGDDMRVVYYPHKRRITRIQRIRTETEEDEKKSKKDSSGTHAIYVTGSDKGTDDEIAIIEEDSTDGVHVVSYPEPKPAMTDEALRYMYYLAHHMNPALFHSGGYPYSYALSENQIAWINSLHPEVRDKYLRNMYNSHVVDDSGRVAAHLKDYSDPSHWIHYKNPYNYSGRRLAAIMENTLSNYDYSCYQAERDGSVTDIRAPALQNAHIYRYDGRRNPNYPHNHYYTAIYRCNAGYVLYDYRVNELYCSKQRWVGTSPVCVPAH